MSINAAATATATDVIDIITHSLANDRAELDTSSG
jgi:hypothetical protein